MLVDCIEFTMVRESYGCSTTSIATFRCSPECTKSVYSVIVRLATRLGSALLKLIGTRRIFEEFGSYRINCIGVFLCRRSTANARGCPRHLDSEDAKGSQLGLDRFLALPQREWYADLQANDFTGDHEFDPPILLPACRGVIRGYGLGFSKALGSYRTHLHSLLG
jgi:hypothetical protein